jgi:hypothetical protein
VVHLASVSDRLADDPSWGPRERGFRVSRETSEALHRLAAKRGSPMSDLVVEILEKGLHEAAKAERRRGRIAE